MDPPIPISQRSLWSLSCDIRSLLEGVTNDVWQHLDDDMIYSCYCMPLEWIPLMKRIAVAIEYVQAATQGDASMEDEEKSNEEEALEEETKSEEEDDDFDSD